MCVLGGLRCEWGASDVDMLMHMYMHTHTSPDYIPAATVSFQPIFQMHGAGNAHGAPTWLTLQLVHEMRSEIPIHPRRLHHNVHFTAIGHGLTIPQYVEGIFPASLRDWLV